MKCKACKGSGIDKFGEGCFCCKGSGSIVRKPVGFLEWLTCKLIKITINNASIGAYQSPWLMVIMKTIKNQMDKIFIEDNESTRIAHLINIVIKSSDMEEDWVLYKKLNNIVN